MDRQFLNSPSFNKSTIMDNILAPNGHDGSRAYKDLQALVHEEKIRQFARKLLFVGSAGTLFSLYNITRYAQLSPSGGPAAIGGFLFFSLMTYNSASRAGFIGRAAVIQE